MPDIQEITARYERKVQLSQYEPVTYSTELRAEVEADETADEAYAALAELAEDMVERELARRIDQKKLADE